MKSRVFVTGASGYLGGAIAARLARGGYDVFGLTRDPDGAATLQRSGVHPVLGDLHHLQSYIGTLKNCDAAVHAAYAHEGSAALDHTALLALRDAVEDGRVRRVLYTSGGWVHGESDLAVDESTPLAPHELVRWRAAHEDIVMDLGSDDLAAIVLRPAMIYGGSGGVFGAWFREAHESGLVTYAGDGSQRWPLVHVNDVAEAYALALEHAPGGERYLLADGSTYTVRELAEAVASAAGARPRPMPREEVLLRMGVYGSALLGSLRVNAGKARRDLGWVPEHTDMVGGIAGLHREWLGPATAAVT